MRFVRSRLVLVRRGTAWQAGFGGVRPGLAWSGGAGSVRVWRGRLKNK